MHGKKTCGALSLYPCRHIPIDRLHLCVCGAWEWVGCKVSECAAVFCAVRCSVLQQDIVISKLTSASSVCVTCVACLFSRARERKKAKMRVTIFVYGVLREEARVREKIGQKGRDFCKHPARETRPACVRIGRWKRARGRECGQANEKWCVGC